MNNIIFELSDKEMKAAKEWKDEHKKVCPHSFANENLPALGEHWYYKFIPCGIGDHKSVGCIYCNKEHDITDISEW